MKILITGAKGQLGTELQNALENKKCEIGPLDSTYYTSEYLALSSKDLDISNFDKAKEIIAKVPHISKKDRLLFIDLSRGCLKALLPIKKL